MLSKNMLNNDKAKTQSSCHILFRNITKLLRCEEEINNRQEQKGKKNVMQVCQVHLYIINKKNVVLINQQNPTLHSLLLKSENAVGIISLNIDCQNLSMYSINCNYFIFSNPQDPLTPLITQAIPQDHSHLMINEVTGHNSFKFSYQEIHANLHSFTTTEFSFEWYKFCHKITTEKTSGPNKIS